MCEEQEKTKVVLLNEIVGELDLTDIKFDYYTIFGLKKPESTYMKKKEKKFVPLEHIFKEKATENDLDVIEEMLLMIIQSFMGYEEGHHGRECKY